MRRGRVGLCLAVVLAPSVALGQGVDEERLLAGHLLRRLGFGPNNKELTAVLQKGRAAYVEQQLDPKKIDDSDAEKRLPPKPKNIYNDYAYQQRWYLRMVYSRRQLLEKMTLSWHEHFATSNDKVGTALLMAKQEDLFRKNALGKFPDLLKGITKDQAMLYFLDNDYNNGNAFDDEGNRLAPNVNYAREMLQVFSTGPVLLNRNGTPVTAGGIPVPAYSEEDIREAARALTGWHLDYKRERFAAAIFEPDLHDSGDKTFLGATITGRTGMNGAKEVDDVVAIVMQHPSTAPFIAKMLIQKLATETPSPAYVQRVADVFAGSGGEIRSTVRAILNDADFTSPAVVRTQYKTPIEQFVGFVRALDAKTKGNALIDWSYYARHLIYYPPSVFSFYPPGKKSQLVNSALATYRDRAADDFVSWNTDTGFDAGKLIRKNALATPAQAVDFLSDRLLVAPLGSDVRGEVIAYMDGRVDDEKLRGAAWLILCSPDYQRN